jgi:hypothetical protein
MVASRSVDKPTVNEHLVAVSDLPGVTRSLASGTVVDVCVGGLIHEPVSAGRQAPTAAPAFQYQRSVVVSGFGGWLRQ